MHQLNCTCQQCAYDARELRYVRYELARGLSLPDAILAAQERLYRHFGKKAA
jgi:hypothetical protein